MKIATNYEIWNKYEMLIRRIKAGEEVCTWSVQDTDGSDDIYNGTFNQCRKVAKRMHREGRRISGIALIQLDERMCFSYCHEFYPIEEL